MGAWVGVGSHYPYAADFCHIGISLFLDPPILQKKAGNLDVLCNLLVFQYFQCKQFILKCKRAKPICVSSLAQPAEFQLANLEAMILKPVCAWESPAGLVKPGSPIQQVGVEPENVHV